MEPTRGLASGAAAAMIGRDTELLAVQRFVDGSGGAACLVVCGEPGIGKTTLWEAGLELAVAQGDTVLSARASEAEAGLSFAVLADLIHAVHADVLAGLPGPQRHALDVALRRADPVEGTAPEPFAISAGFSPCCVRWQTADLYSSPSTMCAGWIRRPPTRSSSRRDGSPAATRASCSRGEVGDHPRWRTRSDPRD